MSGKIDYAQLRVGLAREEEISTNAIITLHGKQLEVPLEDCADRLRKGGYGTTKMVNLGPADLLAENTVTISFPDGDEGTVGTIVIRATVKQ